MEEASPEKAALFRVFESNQLDEPIEFGGRVSLFDGTGVFVEHFYLGARGLP